LPVRAYGSALTELIDVAVRAMRGARNEFIEVEHESQEELTEREREMAQIVESVARESGHPDPEAAAARAIEAAAQRQTARTKPKALTDAIRLDSPPHARHNPRHGSTVDQPADGLATTNRRAVGCADVLLAVVLVRAAQGGRPR